MIATELDLSSLQDDGDVLNLDDVRTLRLRVEPDYSTSVDDFPDMYGRVADTESERVSDSRVRSLRDPDTGYYRRPSGFDGNAEKITSGRDSWWWQPPKDVRREDPNFASLRREVAELCEFGFLGMILEVLEGADAYGRGIVVKTASLWGIESTADEEYRTEVVRELAAELDI